MFVYDYKHFIGIIPNLFQKVKEGVFTFISIVEFVDSKGKNELCFMTSIVTFAKSMA